MSDYYYYASVGWHSREITALPTGELETPFGTMKLECRENWRIYGEIENPVVIHRIPYRIAVEFDFDRQAEEWRVFNRAIRVRMLDKPDYTGKNWQAVGGYAEVTEAAHNAIKKAITPELFEAWAEQHYELIHAANSIEVKQMIERAFHWCDEQEERLTARRQMLKRVQEEFQKTGQVSDADRYHLKNVYSWKL
jgi:Ser/Thr protein kinase RdoA (MazF antagonist)